MARHLLTDPSVRPIVHDLVRLVLHEGSVNAAQRRLVSTLAEDKSEGWLYPNRLHTLLSDDGSRAVNSETLEILQRAMSRLPAEVLDSEAARARTAEYRTAALQAWEAAAAALVADGPSSMVRVVADRLDLPPAIAAWVLNDAGLTEAQSASTTDRSSTAPVPRSEEPDWSFQDTAHSRCLESLARDPNRKAGLVLPTGAGKTRVAMRIALSALDRSARADSIVLWVTHRTRLKTQAHRELQRAITTGTPDLPDNAVALLGDRVAFCMLSDLADRLGEFGDRVALVIVDEAHHAAARSYEPIFDRRPLHGLFLTATPNRTDLIPIGIDEIAYSITSRELFDRGVIIEPQLETLILEQFNWDSAEERRNLADVLLDRAQNEFVKTLVAVSRVEYAETLYESLVDVLDEYDRHVLGPDDVGFVHGSGTSTSNPADVFLDEFAVRPRGLLVATAQLLGEGFDDPSINTVVVTYPTTSMVQLMQAAGRCLRWAPNKKSAHVVQVKDSALAYHWEQRWLYQDISDLLRPQLFDHDYSTFDDLAEQVEQLLERANVPAQAVTAVRASLAEVEPGEHVTLLLTGLPYDGPADRFEQDAAWNAVLATPRDRSQFLSVFNDFSGRGADVNNFGDFLRNYLQPDPAPSSRWKRYIDMLHGMSYARREITGEDYDGAHTRPFTAAVGTTWLRYISFRYDPAVPSDLDAFLGDAVNRDEVVAQYSHAREAHELAVKIPLPLAGTIAFLLDRSQSDWLVEQRERVRTELAGLDAVAAFGFLSEWVASLQSSPVPLLIVQQLARLVRGDHFAALTLALGDRRVSD